MAMTGRILAAAVVAVLISVITPAPVLADEFRVIDPMGKEDTSRCIGDPRTPLCALETLYACIYRGDISLCDKVGYDHQAVFGNRRPGAYAKLSYHRIRETGRKTLGAADIPPGFGGAGPKKWRTGDIAIQIYLEGCPPHDQCVTQSRNDPNRYYGEGCRGFHRCTEFPGVYLTEVFRRAPGGWRSVGGYGADDLPAGFWKRK